MRGTSVSLLRAQAGYHCADCWTQGLRTDRCRGCGALQQLILGPEVTRGACETQSCAINFRLICWISNGFNGFHPLRKYSIDQSARMQVVTGDALEVRWAAAYEPLGLLRAFGENGDLELEMMMKLRGAHKA